MRSSTQDAVAAVGIALISFLVVIAIIGLCCALGAVILMWAWNHSMPAIFGLPQVTFVQAFALSMVAGCIRSVTTVQAKKE